MTSIDRPAFALAMMRMAAVFNQPMNELRLEGYFVALEAAEIPAIERAIAETIKKSRFMPAPVELLDAIFGSGEDMADAAWNNWRREASRVGAAGEPNIDSCAKRAILDVFGSWPDACLCECSAEMFAHRRKQFIAAYKRYWERANPRFALTDSSPRALTP